MAFQLGNAYGKVSVDASGVKSGVSQATSSLQQLSQVGTMVGGALKSAGQVLTVGLTLPLAALGATSVKAAMDAESAMAELNAVLESTGGIAGVTAQQVTEYAKAMQKVTMFDDEAIIGGQSMLLTFTKIGKEVFPLAANATLNMAQKFGSVEQAAMQVGKALNDPIAGVGALRRVGVSLSEQQEQQIKDFMAVNDIASAQKIILKELEVEFGGLAEAAGATTAGKFAQFKNELNDVQEIIGGTLIPYLLFFTQVLRTLLGIFQAMPSWMQGGIVAFGALLAILGPVLLILGQLITTISSIAGAWSSIAALFPVLSTALTAIGTAITTTVIPALAGIGTTITATVLPAIGAALVAMAPIILTIGLIALAFGLLWAAWEFNFLGFRTTLEQLGFIIAFYFNQGIEAAKVKMAEMGPALNQWANEFMTTLQQLDFIVQFYIGQAMKAAVGSIINAGVSIVRAWQQMIANIQIAWTAFTVLLNTTWQQAWNMLISYLSGAVNNVLNYIANLRDSIFAYFNIDWSSIGANIINGIIAGIVNGTSALIASIVAAVTAALAAAKAALGISSPSKKFAYLGQMSALGYMNEFSKNVDPAQVARSMARVTQQPASSMNYSQTNHFASGLTTRDVQRMMDERDQHLFSTFSQAFGSA